MLVTNDVQHYIKEAQSGDREKLHLLTEKFEPKVKNCLHYTNRQEREDLHQELMVKLIELALAYDTEKAPNFEEFYHKSEGG